MTVKGSKHWDLPWDYTLLPEATFMVRQGRNESWDLPPEIKK